MRTITLKCIIFMTLIFCGAKLIESAAPKIIRHYGDNVVVCDQKVGIYWEQVLGGYKFTIINPNCHKGQCGRLSCYNVHVNFYVYQPTGNKNENKQWGILYDFHIFRYKNGNRECLYIWESKFKKDFDSCGNIVDTISQSYQFLKTFSRIASLLVEDTVEGAEISGAVADVIEVAMVAVIVV
ncbi:1102_t:CDS:2 [Acaulospora morrowiae]|uniref:1102_t:CDS:1 n=1 Tax=Acaulospora morrowiae TaxID=94023 RepID=A0A9N9E105_9GLOM|nr:1102_t:CDS:2 [Acaulospora morrowiae]